MNRSLSTVIKYSSALEDLNKEIAKQQEERNLFITYTSDYRDALAKEVELQKEKLSALQEFAEELEHQSKL